MEACHTRGRRGREAPYAPTVPLNWCVTKIRYQEEQKTFVFNVTMSIAHVHIDPKSA